MGLREVGLPIVSGYKHVALLELKNGISSHSLQLNFLDLLDRGTYFRKGR
jgi:hypothetical protein